VAFYNPGRIGLVEKAARIALKYRVVYDAHWQEFKGDASRVQTAKMELDKWLKQESDRDFRANLESGR
jgi:hypothetical protein